MGDVKLLPEDYLNEEFMDTPNTDLPNDYLKKYFLIVEDFNDAASRYKKIFGKDSLRRVIFTDPLEATARETLKEIDELEQAIATNTPIEQVDPELWKTMIF